jgi:hypothetical protein
LWDTSSWSLIISLSSSTHTLAWYFYFHYNFCQILSVIFLFWNQLSDIWAWKFFLVLQLCQNDLASYLARFPPRPVRNAPTVISPAENYLVNILYVYIQYLYVLCNVQKCKTRNKTTDCKFFVFSFIGKAFLVYRNVWGFKKIILILSMHGYIW